MTWPSNNQQKKRTLKIVDFAVPSDHRVKLKESDKYLDLARELKKLWNMKVSVIPIVISALDTRTGGLGNKRMSGNYPSDSIVEISQNTEKSPGDFRRFGHSDSSGQPSANDGVKKSQKRNNNNRYIDK